MKKTLFLLVVPLIVAGLLNSFALALSPVGPPMAGLKEGQSSLGFDFSNSDIDIKATGPGLSGTLEDVDSQLYFANLGLGLLDNFELFVRLGICDHEFEAYQGGSGFAYGFGTKLTLSESDPMSWGMLFQMTWSESSDTLSEDVPPLGVAGDDIDVDIIEIQIALGPTYKTGNFCLYGGPFLHLIDGDLDRTNLGVTSNFDLKEKSELGGFLGAQLDTSDSSSLYVEYQLTDDASAICAGYVWRF